MRPLSLCEREELMLRAGECDLLDFVHQLKYLRRRYKLPIATLLEIMDRAPKPTNLPVELLQFVRNMLAEEGRELTPNELAATVETILCKIRNVMLVHGLQVPSDDVKLLKSLF